MDASLNIQAMTRVSRMTRADADDGNGHGESLGRTTSDTRHTQQAEAVQVELVIFGSGV